MLRDWASKSLPAISAYSWIGSLAGGARLRGAPRHVHPLT